jgi:hypothetical protein
LLYVVGLPGTGFVGGFGVRGSDVLLRLLRKELVEGKTLSTSARRGGRMPKYMIE